MTGIPPSHVKSLEITVIRFLSAPCLISSRYGPKDIGDTEIPTDSDHKIKEKQTKTLPPIPNEIKYF